MSCRSPTVLPCLSDISQVLREQYLAYRRVFLQDSTDVFEERRRRREAEAERGKVKTGPPPFSAAMGQATTALAAFSTGSGEWGRWGDTE